MATLLALGVLMLSPLPPATAPDTTALMTEDIPTLANGDHGPVLAGHAYAAARHMGARMLRVHTGRDALFGWEHRVDPFVEGALARGFEPYVTLTYRRRYRNTAEDTGFLGVPDPPELAAWCGEAAARYAGRVRHYGVFNEPNYFGDGMTPRRYNALFRACQAAIAAADPEARVYYGEVAADEDAPAPCRWVTRSLSPTEPTVADGLAIHTYQWRTPPELPSHGFCRGIGRLGDWDAMRSRWAARGLLTASGVGSDAGPDAVPDAGTEAGPVPLLITEHGYCAADGECPPRDDGSGAASRLDEVTRADWARRAYLWARDHGVEVFSWYHLVNQPPGDQLWDSGIVTQTGEPTLAVDALRDAVESPAAGR